MRWGEQRAALTVAQHEATVEQAEAGWDRTLVAVLSSSRESTPGGAKEENAGSRDEAGDTDTLMHEAAAAAISPHSRLRSERERARVAASPLAATSPAPAGSNRAPRDLSPPPCDLLASRFRARSRLAHAVREGVCRTLISDAGGWMLPVVDRAGDEQPGYGAAGCDGPRGLPGQPGVALHGGRGRRR